MPEAARDEAWVELLLTDSLDRPLGLAPYMLEVDGEIERGRLSPGGRLSFRWPAAPAETTSETPFSPRVRLFICHRTLRLGAGPSEGALWDRNRLTNLGFDAGPPTLPLDEEQLASAFAAFARTARDHDLVEEPPRALLERWYAGAAGVSSVLPGAAFRGASPEGFLRRWRARRVAKKTGFPRSGSHLGDDQDALGGVADVAVVLGKEGSPKAQNRVVVLDWFSGYGRPPRDGNLVVSLIDGEEAWGAVADDIEAASGELCISSWFVDPDIELRRPVDLALAPAELRAPHRLSNVIERLARRGGRTALLVWSWLGTPLFHRTLRRWAVTEDDGVEVLQHSHPNWLGSFHEKTIVVDRKVAYCGGFNLRQNDWDTQAHAVVDARRNPHDTSGEDRAESEPAYPPRHDITLRLEGPIVADVHANFVEHWNGTLADERRALRRWLGRIMAWLAGSGPAAPIRRMGILPEAAGAMLAQFVRTDPRLNKREQAVVDVTLRAIMNARKLIYIENQFFRSPRVAETIVAALQRRPRLQIIVVTNEVLPPLLWLNPYAYWTHLVQEMVRAEREDFTLYQLLSSGMIEGEAVYRHVFIHAKVMVIDDVWATVGSANINDRSIYSEFEANVAVEDEGFAQTLRRRLMAEHLSLSPDDPRLADPLEAAALFRELASENAEARRDKRLSATKAHPFYQAGAWKWIRGRPEWF